MPKILIIDDDHVLASLYKLKFKAGGFDVDVAETGESGLLKLRQNTPDIVLLDLMLGDMNGVEVLELLRKHEVTRKLPVVVFSSAFMGNLMELAAKAGANKCLSKTSCPPNRLVDEVKAVLAACPPPPRPDTSGLPPAIRPTLKFDAKPAPLAAAAASVEEDTQQRIRQDMLQTIRARLEEAQRVLPQWVTSAHVPHAPFLPALYRAVHAVAGTATIAGRLRLAQVAGALEAMLQELRSYPSSVTASAVRTVTQGVNLLPALTRNAESAQAEAFPSPLILVVDCDRDQRDATCQALERAQLRALGIANAVIAEMLFATNRLDLVIVDESVKEIDGIDLCSHLRDSPENVQTPVILITPRDEGEVRLQLKGGVVDPITKPFLPIELAVKGLIHLHRGRLNGIL